MNMKKKNCVLQHAEGRGTQLFHLIFTKPRVNLLGHHCTPRMFSSDELVQKKHYNNRVESELAHDVEEYTDKGLGKYKRAR